MGKKRIEVVVDRRGSIDIRGFSEKAEGEEAARKLGLTQIYPILKQDGVDPARMDQVVGRARILGYSVRELGPDGELTALNPEAQNTRSAGGESGSGARVAKRAVAVALVTGVVALLSLMALDHLERDYSPVPSIANALTLAEQDPVDVSGILGLINPPDSPYVSFVLGDWSHIEGTTAITEGHYIRMPGLKSGSFQRLVGEARSTILLFRTNVWESEPGRLQVDAILRDGQETSETDLLMEVYPLASGPSPEGYATDHAIVFDRVKSFQDLRQFAVEGRLEQTERGLCVMSEGFNVAVSDAFHATTRLLLQDRLANSETPVSGTFYLTLTETFPWTAEGGEPTRRQLHQDIGVARLDGVQLADLYVANPVP